MKNLFLSLVCTFFLLFVNAQKVCIVGTAKGFAVTIYPGMVQVDENGNEIRRPLQYNRNIYLTTNCNIAPTISYILYDTVKANFSIRAIAEKSIEIGKDNSGKKVVVSSNKQYLWEVNIDLGQNQIEPNSKRLIIIKGKINKKPFRIGTKEINISPTFLPV